MPFPLDTFRAVLGYNPWHFWGQSNDLVPVTDACNTRVLEYAWQAADATGRHEIRQAIQTAEERLFEYLKFRVRPQYVEKLIQFPRPANAAWQYMRPVDASGRWLSLNLKEGYIREMGIEQLLAIDEPAVVYSDEDGDQLIDTFTLTIATALTNQEQLAVYFNAADRQNEAVGEDWRIEPVKARVSGGNTIITGPSWLMVRPIKYRGVRPQAIDPNDTTLLTNNFAQTVEVYRRSTNGNGALTSNAQAVLVWESNPPPWSYPCLNPECTQLLYDTSGEDPAGLAYAVARAQIRNPRTGEVYMGEATFDEDNQVWVKRNWGGCRQPDRVIVRYLAGADRREINSRIYSGGSWEQIVARLAMAELSRPICGCDMANQSLYHWQFDMSRAAGANDEQYSISPADLNNPLGTRRGAVYAWKQVQNLKVTRGVLV